MLRPLLRLQIPGVVPQPRHHGGFMLNRKNVVFAALEMIGLALSQAFIQPRGSFKCPVGLGGYETQRRHDALTAWASFKGNPKSSSFWRQHFGRAVLPLLDELIQKLGNPQSLVIADLLEIARPLQEYCDVAVTMALHVKTVGMLQGKNMDVYRQPEVFGGEEYFLVANLLRHAKQATPDNEGKLVRIAHDLAEKLAFFLSPLLCLAGWPENEQHPTPLAQAMDKGFSWLKDYQKSLLGEKQYIFKFHNLINGAMQATVTEILATTDEMIQALQISWEQISREISMAHAEALKPLRHAA